MESAINVLNWIAVNVPWKEIFESGALTAAVTVLLVPVYRIVKKYYDHHKEVMVIAVGLTGLVASYVQAYLSANPSRLGYASIRGFAIAFGTQPFYKIVLKPLTSVIVSGVSAQIAKAKSLSEAQSAAVPAEGIPTPAHADFSH